VSGWKKGVLLAVVQVALVASLGAKLKWDRTHLPRVWAKVQTYDPDLPIRGRYLALRLQVKPVRATQHRSGGGGALSGWEAVEPKRELKRLLSDLTESYVNVSLRAEKNELVGEVVEPPQGYTVVLRDTAAGREGFLQEPVLYFLPEHAPDPWQQARGGELWAEVSVPPNGPPRPIRLAIKHGDSFTPLEIP
jgi:hypothetical protein